MMNSRVTAGWRCGTALAALAIASVGTPAFAQDATNNQPGVPAKAPTPGMPAQQITPPTASSGPDSGINQPAAPTSNTNAGSANQEIVITGTLIPRRTTSETPSPVTVISQESMDQRGIQTAGEALQRLSANGAASVGSGWNNGNNFAAGAIAPSLRGLTVQKTLSIFDGLRMAPYPIADDGHRNFVDISTIPDNVIDRIEVLKDGASSTYGADAVAGVVNIITKKQIQGLHANVAYGNSEHGGGRSWRVDGSAGYGDLDSDGFNVYVAGTWRKEGAIYARDRQFPWNTGYYSKICDPGGSGACLANGTRWAIFAPNADGSLGGSSVPMSPLVAPATAAGAVANTYQLLNSNCGATGSVPVNLTTAQRQAVPGSGGAVPLYPTTVCGADMKNLFGTVQPETERYGVTARATIKVGDKAQAYMEGNYFRTHTYSQFSPAAISTNTTTPPLVTPGFVPILPVYVCPQGVATISPTTGVMTSTGCTAANGTLNPNNPFAANGQNAVLRWRYDRPQIADTTARALRAAGGISGTFGDQDEWNYNVEGTASEVRWDRKYANYIVPQRVADVIANGTFNFVNLAANSDAIRDYIAPVSHNIAVSDLWQVNATLGRSLFELPGGPLAGAVGLSVRHEAINDPSGNPVDPSPSFNPYSRYFTINAVGAVGSRNVKSAYFEVNAPFMSEKNNGMGLEVDVSGRYDKYSTGQKNFSPKVGAKFTPIRQLALRGTWSRGFRVPSFNESFGLPTTGYTNNAPVCPAAAGSIYASFCAAHANDVYVTSPYQFGRTATGNPNLAPEKSTSFTAGAIFEPIRNLSFTVDYFNIKVKNTIAQVSSGDQTAALNAYFQSGNTTAVPGVVVIPGVVDPQFPAAQALPGFVQFSYQNADTEKVTGLDFSMAFNHRFGAVKWSSYAEASYLMLYEIIRKGGAVERYDGTLSPCDYTSCSGSPKWRGNWQNTFDFGRASLTATVYYTSGYDTQEVDYGGIRHVCPDNVTQLKYKGSNIPVACSIGAQWNADLSGSFKVNQWLTIYGNVLDFLDIKPKFDPMAAYGIFNYNVIFGQPNMIGRFYRIGAKIDFVPRKHVVAEPVVLPPPPPPPAATVTCESGAVIQAPGVCPQPAPPPPPPPAPAPERG